MSEVTDTEPDSCDVASPSPMTGPCPIDTRTLLKKFQFNTPKIDRQQEINRLIDNLEYSEVDMFCNTQWNIVTKLIEENTSPHETVLSEKQSTAILHSWGKHVVTVESSYFTGLQKLFKTRTLNSQHHYVGHSITEFVRKEVFMICHWAIE